MVLGLIGRDVKPSVRYDSLNIQALGISCRNESLRRPLTNNKIL